MASVVRSCRPAGVLLPCGGNGSPLRLWSVPAVLLVFYCPAVVMVRRGVYRPSAVLLALYCRAVVLVRRVVCGVWASILPPCVGIVPPSVVCLLALYRRALILFRRGVRSCWFCYFSDVAFIVLPFRLSSVCGFRWLSIALRWYWSAVACVVRSCRSVGTLLPCG